MENFLEGRGFKSCETWGNEKLFESQTQNGHLFAKSGEVIFESAPSFFNHAMKTQSLENPGYLSPAFIREMLAQGLVAESVNVKLTTSDNRKQCLVILIKEIETLVASFSGFDSFGDGVQFLYSIARSGKSRDKIKIPVIGCLEQANQGEKTINTTFQIGDFFDPPSVSLIHLPICSKLSDIVDRGFDTQYETKLIVHFDGICTHMVTDSGPLNPSIKIVTYFALI